MVLNADCDASNAATHLLAVDAGNGHFVLQNVENGLCVHPVSGEADDDGIMLVLGTDCSTSNPAILFTEVDNGDGTFALQNVQHSRCVHPSADQNQIRLMFKADCAASGQVIQFRRNNLAPPSSPPSPPTTPNAGLSATASARVGCLVDCYGSSADAAEVNGITAVANS